MIENGERMPVSSQNANQKSNGVTPVTPGFMSNSQSTPPQFEHPTLHPKQLKFNDQVIVRNEP